MSVPKLEQPMAEEASSMTSTRSMTGLDHRLRSVSVGDVAEHNATVSDATPPQTEPPMLKLADKPSERPLLKPVPASPTMPLKRESPQQRSENLYRQAVALLGQGCVAEARTLLYRSLEENTANHHARQLLAGLLLESQQLDDALPLLKEGVRMAPDQTGLVMALARLQADAGDYKAALQTMEQGAAFAGADDADFAGLHAALLQREERHAEAIPRYLAALHGDPANVSWLVGLGISLEAENRRTDAREAYERAKQTGALPPELSEFVEQRLQSLKGP
ncbi:MAG: tetratricopeptide repeat protein [Methylophilaceae bacterium]|nr:tetratricopeptide repeat protein [Methylophilaceae bacterium]